MTLTKYACANISSEPSCFNEGHSACGSCRLVMYCSKACQKSHWPDHKTDCKAPFAKQSWKPSWHTMGRRPAFVNDQTQSYVPFGSRNKYLWGNMPAIDLLATQRGEAATTEEVIRVLLAASGDLRNFVKTVASLPATNRSGLMLTLNDRDPDIVIRNLIMLMILEVEEDEATAVDCVLHLWYSARITEKHQAILDSVVRPLIQEVIDKTSAKDTSSMLGKTWTWSGRTLRAILTKKAWDDVLLYLEPLGPDAVDRTQQNRLAITLAPEREDHLHRYLYTQDPPRRICRLQFRRDGILLPFGFTRRPFVVPNPTIFRGEMDWPMKDSADPLDGWNASDVEQTIVGHADNDMYGKLYFHLKEQLSSCHRALRRCPVSFHLFNLDVTALVDHLDHQSFARIEVSNIADACYMGLGRTLALFIPFLQPQSKNPDATLITLLMNAVEEEFNNCGATYDPAVMKREVLEVAKYIPYRPGLATYDPDFLRASFAKPLVRDVDLYLRQYLEQHRLPYLTALLGCELQPQNRIIARWPGKLKLRRGQPGAEEEFSAAFKSTLSGTECYLEWCSKP